jgi:putative MATE family efflux protein
VIVAPVRASRAQDREILRLALPALGALVAEPLFLLADCAIVGHLGTPQLAGLGIAGAVLAGAVYLCVFLAYGTTAAVARRLGAGDLGGALRQGVDGMWLGFVVGVGLAVAGVPLTPAVVGWLGGDGEVAGCARTYLWTSLPGLPAMLVVLAATGVLRGLQDTRTPLVVAVAAATGNLALNVLLVYGAGLGIAGSALGTVIAQYAAATAFVAVVVRGSRPHGIGLRPDPAGLRLAAAAGVPLFVRTLSLRVVLLVATAVATHLGDREVAAHQVAFAIWTFLALGLDAIAIAGQAIVGRCLGAGDVGAARAATRRMLEWSVVAGVGTGALVIATRGLSVPLFTTDAAVRDLLARVLIVVGSLQPLAGAVFALDGILIGAGDGRYLAWAGLGTMAAFLAATAAIVGSGGGLLGLWAAIGVFMLARLAALGPRAASDAWLVPGAAAPGRRGPRATP